MFEIGMQDFLPEFFHVKQIPTLPPELAENFN
jgi:hypothetical protein